MYHVDVTVTGVGVSNPIPMDQYLTPFNVGLGATINSGTATYTVQHTFDDVYASNYNPSTGTWFNQPDITAVTTNQDGNYAFPVSAIRLNVSASTGSVTLHVLQAGVTG